MLHLKRWLCIALFAFLSIFSNAQQKQPSTGESQDSFSLFLIGNTGKDIENDANPVLDMLQTQLSTAGPNSSVIFLGDNIYPKGLPPIGSSHRKTAENIILHQIDALKGFSGKSFFIPGNHDWKKGKRNGWEHVKNQEAFIESKMDSMNVFFPDNGCPGPVEIAMTNDLILVLLDTQWLLHPWEKPEADEDCAINSVADILIQIEDILRRNADKKIVVAAHHPLYSYGIHGGVTNFNEHLFPLRSLNKSLYVPLPIIGSIYPLYRKLIGNIQDIKHPKYKAMKEVFLKLFSRHPNLIYVAGHENSIQYIGRDSLHFIVSGAGATSSHVKKKGYAKYADSRTGFAKLNFSKDGKVNLEIWQINSNQLPEKTYETLLFTQPYQPPTLPDFDAIDYGDSTVTTNASNQYVTKKTILSGNNYRDVWNTKIPVKVFDIGKEKGGLKIVQRGGGQQTRSLRLEAKNGKQYVLRSIEKFTTKVVPEALRGTIASDIVQDQISASHPYGAIAIPILAKAANIYHTNPSIVYLPKDPRLGKYRDYFGGGLYLFEERPHGDQSDAPNFGNSNKIYSTSKMLKELYKDNDNKVDQLWTIKSRLFDMLIGDWDRHDDQWRWASFESDNGKIFRPIPRDRDQAFFINDGIFMKFAKQKWALPQFQGFDDQLKYVPGFNYNARYFDRDFINESSLEDWLAMADSLQHRITDEIIEEAVHQWPTEIFKLHGKEVIEKLKSQRNNLPKYAKEQYLFLAKEVSVRGTNKNEQFEITRINDLKTHVKVYKKTKSSTYAKLIYDRIFLTSETDEIILYGLKGQDVFKVTGKVKKGPIIRIISGPDRDEIIDESNVAGLGRKTRVYDDFEDNLVMPSSETRDQSKNDPMVHNYNRKSFTYDKLSPLIYANINRDDGFSLGSGFRLTKYGFRKIPYKSDHLLNASFAFGTNSFNLNYNATFMELLGGWDLLLKSAIFSPDYTANFFGIGNTTAYNKHIDDITNNSDAIDFYRIRYNQFSGESSVRKRIGETASLSIGARAQMFKVESDDNDEDRFYGIPENIDNDDEFFNWKSFAGAFLNFTVDMRDKNHLPSRGINLSIDLQGNKGINKKSSDYAELSGAFSLFLNFRLPAEIIVASRVGVGHTFGDYEFYQAQKLGGLSTIRGYRKTRFHGDTRLYHNFELRTKITTIKNPILPITMGVNLFNDVGRLWVRNESSGTVHHGYGAGLWFAPLNAAVLAFDVGHSREGTGFYVRLGFLF